LAPFALFSNDFKDAFHTKNAIDNVEEKYTRWRAVFPDGDIAGALSKKRGAKSGSTEV